MISGFEKKLVVYDHEDCKLNVKKITDKNEKEEENVIDITKNFNEKYGKGINNFYGREEGFKYEFENISKICDAYIADYTDTRRMTQFFEKTRINDKNAFLEECNNVIGINFKDKLYGDNNMEVLRLEESVVLKEMIHYMKLRVNADINNETIIVSDYSKPKMVIISGHDTTLAAQILFLIKIFQLDIVKYKLPTYSSQVAVEVSRNKTNNEEKLKYSDYYVKVYFNDDLLLNVTMDIFINNVEKNIWNQERIDLFCYGEKKEDIKFNYYIIIIICISIIIVALLIIIIILIAKIKRKEDDKDSIDSDNLINDD
jgi:bisphosphoglycerate-dependent phosphoglycerate mutase